MHRTRRMFAVTATAIALVAGGAGLAGCGGSSSGPGGTSGPQNPTVTGHAATTATPSLASQSERITIENDAFSPATVTVRRGTTVTWLNNDDEAHTATASNRTFDSGDLARGQKYSFTFATAGTFAYTCTIHPFMRGTIIVQ